MKNAWIGIILFITSIYLPVIPQIPKPTLTIPLFIFLFIVTMIFFYKSWKSLTSFSKVFLLLTGVSSYPFIIFLHCFEKPGDNPIGLALPIVFVGFPAFIITLVSFIKSYLKSKNSHR